MTATGTNLLGLVKHAATWEARYFGEVFERPTPEAVPRWQDSDGMLDDTTRHAGHADILRELIDGRTGFAARYEEPVDSAAREALCARIEEAAQAAQTAQAAQRTQTESALG